MSFHSIYWKVWNISSGCETEEAGQLSLGDAAWEATVRLGLDITSEGNLIYSSKYLFLIASFT